MGSGKTTIGFLLARKFSLEFKDLDREVELRLRSSISGIFKKVGETGFRKYESEILSSLFKEDEIVLATGGGSILLPKNRKVLRKSGIIVYLESSAKELVTRLSGSTTIRPLIDIINPENSILRSLKDRESLYANISDIIIKTDKKDPESIASEIFTLVKELKQQ